MKKERVYLIKNELIYFLINKKSGQLLGLMWPILNTLSSF